MWNDTQFGYLILACFIGIPCVVAFAGYLAKLIVKDMKRGCKK